MFFLKRTYRLKEFLHDAFNLISSSLNLVRHTQRRRVEPAFREKIMLAVSSVLNCRFCSWLHTELILKEGVEKTEIKRLLEGKFEDLPEQETLAIAFAIHYAETHGRPKREMLTRFFDYYGVQAESILIYIKAIYWGNLTGNTVEAFLDRLRGKPVKESRFLDELAIFSLTAPYFLIILPFIGHIVKITRKRLGLQE